MSHDDSEIRKLSAQLNSDRVRAVSRGALWCPEFYFQTEIQRGAVHTTSLTKKLTRRCEEQSTIDGSVVVIIGDLHSLVPNKLRNQLSPKL